MSNSQNYNHQHSALPAGWEMFIDQASNCPYFVDHNNKTTTWQDPRMFYSGFSPYVPMTYPYPGYPDNQGGIEIPVQHEGFPRQHHPPHGHNIRMERSASPGMREIPIQHIDPTKMNHPDHGSQNKPYTHNIRLERPDSGARSPRPSKQQFEQRQDRGSSRNSPVSMYDRQEVPSRGSPISTPASRNSPISHLRKEESARRSPIPQQQSTARNDTGGPRVIPIVHETSNQPNKPGYSSQPPHRGFESPKPADDENRKPVSMETESEEQAPKQPPKPKTKEEMANEIISGVESEVNELEEKVKAFSGQKMDKEYRYLEEMLTRSLIKLDAVETEGHEDIRQRRKQTVCYIQQTLDMLELKAASNETENEKICDKSNVNMSEEGSSVDNNKLKDNDASVKEMVLDSEVAC